MSVAVNNDGCSVGEAEQAALAAGARAVQRALERAGLGHAEVSLTVGDASLLHELNRRYRGVDRATDVLSFPQYEADELPHARRETSPLLGDIVVSLPHARAQAQEYGHGLAREFAYLAVHGCLHLLGYDHPDEAAEARMHGETEAVLHELGLGR